MKMPPPKPVGAVFLFWIEAGLLLLVLKVRKSRSLHAQLYFSATYFPKSIGWYGSLVCRPSWGRTSFSRACMIRTKSGFQLDFPKPSAMLVVFGDAGVGSKNVSGSTRGQTNKQTIPPRTFCQLTVSFLLMFGWTHLRTPRLKDTGCLFLRAVGVTPGGGFPTRGMGWATEARVKMTSGHGSESKACPQ